MEFGFQPTETSLCHEIVNEHRLTLQARNVSHAVASPSLLMAALSSPPALPPASPPSLGVVWWAGESNGQWADETNWQGGYPDAINVTEVALCDALVVDVGNTQTSASRVRACEDDIVIRVESRLCIGDGCEVVTSPSSQS